MVNVYGFAAQHPVFGTIAQFLSYGAVTGAFVAFAILVRKKIVGLGYPERKALLFTLFAIILFIPLGYYGSRAFGMFHQPAYNWRFELLLENALHGNSHTFYASLLLPLLWGAIVCRILKMKILDIFDAIFLYVPLVYAMGRLYCLFIGYGWGKFLSFSFFGIGFSFYNPLPLYAFAINLCLYFFLKQLHANIYRHQRTRELYHGAVFASYLLLYGTSRIVLEVFGMAPTMLFRLTNAQIFMPIFILAALVIFYIIRLRLTTECHQRSEVDPFALNEWTHHSDRGQLHNRPKRRDKTGPAGLKGNQQGGAKNRRKVGPFQTGSSTTEKLGLDPNDNRHDEKLLSLLSLAGLLAVFMVLSVAIIHLTRVVYVWQWPFRPVHSLSEAYGRIFYYAPMMLIPPFALYWLKKFNIPFTKRFQWGRFSWVFVAALAVSVYYPVDMLLLKGISLRGPAFWPPVLAMSVMNAFAEEIMYRLALYEMLRRASYSRLTSNIVQSLAYSVIHFMIVGPLFGILSLLYGFLLGMVRQRTGTIMPSIVCHFIIDLGAIGMHFMWC